MRCPVHLMLPPPRSRRCPEGRAGGQTQGAEGCADVGRRCPALLVLRAAPSAHLEAVLLLRHGLHRSDRPLHELHEVLVEQLTGDLSAVGFGEDRVDAVLGTGTAPGLRQKGQTLQSAEEGHGHPPTPLRAAPRGWIHSLHPAVPPQGDTLPGAGLIPRELPAGTGDARALRVPPLWLWGIRAERPEGAPTATCIMAISLVISP